MRAIRKIKKKKRKKVLLINSKVVIIIQTIIIIIIFKERIERKEEERRGHVHFLQHVNSLYLAWDNNDCCSWEEQRSSPLEAVLSRTCTRLLHMAAAHRRASFC